MSRQERRESRERSRLIRESTIGTHVVNNARRASGTRVHFGSHRGASRANRGEIRHVTPATRTRESAVDFIRRSHTPDYVAQSIRRRRRRTILLVLALLVAAAVVVAGVVTFVYSSSVDSKMALSDDAARNALVSPSKAEEVHYTLVVGEGVASQGHQRAFMINLVRVNAASHQVTYTAISPDIPVTTSSGETTTLGDVIQTDGDAELIKQVSALTGVDVAHFIKASDKGLEHLVDALDGIDITLPYPVDDPAAGIISLDAGEQTLSGQATATACKASNYEDPARTQGQVQNEILAAITQKLADRGGFDALSTFDSLAEDIKTDLGYQRLADGIEALSSINNPVVQQGVLPVTVSVQSGTVSYRCDKQAVASFMSVVTDGGDASAVADTTQDVDTTGVTVAVRNGGGVNQAASQAAALLRDGGFTVTEVGNTDNPVYDETLVIYRNGDMKAAAEQVVRDLGQGRSTDASVYYSFNSDLLVIVGKNWVASS